MAKKKRPEEKELMDACELKYESTDRQDQLKELFSAQADKLTDDQFNALTVPAQDWANACVAYIKEAGGAVDDADLPEFADEYPVDENGNVTFLLEDDPAPDIEPDTAEDSEDEKEDTVVVLEATDPDIEPDTDKEFDQPNHGHDDTATEDADMPAKKGKTTKKPAKAKAVKRGKKAVAGLTVAKTPKKTLHVVKKKHTPNASSEGAKRRGRWVGIGDIIVALAQRSEGATVVELVDALCKKFPKRRESSLTNSVRAVLWRVPLDQNLPIKKTKEAGRGLVYRLGKTPRKA